MRGRIHASRTLGLELWIRTLHLGTARRRYSGDGYRTFLVPRSEYEIEDTWNVMGLQGTGSNDVVIPEPIFVPEHRTHKQMDGFNCVNDQENPMYDLSWAQTFVRVVNSAAIGALKKAVKVFVESKQGNSTTDMTKFAGDVETQERLAKVLNTIAELEAVMYHNFDKMEAANWKPSLEDRIMYRYQAHWLSIKPSKRLIPCSMWPVDARSLMAIRFSSSGTISTLRVATLPTTQRRLRGTSVASRWAWKIRMSLSNAC